VSAALDWAMVAEVTTDVWEVQDRLRLPGGVLMPLRMTVLRLGRRLLLHSPVALSDDDARAIAALGTPTWVVAPSLLHHRFVRPCLDRWPGATLLGVAGLARKRPDLPWQGEVGSIGDDVQAVTVEGAPAFTEVALHHAPTGTLLVTDLLFNIVSPANRRTAVLLSLMGTRGRLAMSRAWRFGTRDRAALKASVEKILAWPFRRVLPGHGEICHDPERARQALSWATSSG
jgi:hypothetical protein